MPRLYTILKNSLFIFSFLILTTFNPVLSAQEEVISKEKMPLKEIAESENPESEDIGEDQGFIYDPTGKTDPFESFITIAEEKQEEEKKKPKTYLETLELSQLDLVVTVISSKGKWAMFKDSKDVGHVIKEGTLVGTNGGVVYQIKEGEVVIREEYRDFRGQTQYREIIKSSPSSSQ